jgi:hypothetical protein
MPRENLSCSRDSTLEFISYSFFGILKHLLRGRFDVVSEKFVLGISP